MKGFKKDGKFIPTGNKKKSALKKDDVLIDKFGRRSDDPTIKKTVVVKNGVKQIKFDYFGKGDPKYDKSASKRSKESLDEEDLEELAEKLDDKFNEIITVDRGYGRVYGSKNQYYKVGVEEGLDADDIDTIKEDLGYIVHSVEPANENFVDVIFKKSDGTQNNLDGSNIISDKNIKELRDSLDEVYKHQKDLENGVSEFDDPQEEGYQNGKIFALEYALGMIGKND